ncbi:MAG: RagB/SusD family nutrient uptake outer membrane protein [Niabella sp.]
MKYIRIILLMSVIAITSCVKIKEEAFSFISPDNFYKSEKDAEASVIGIYPEVPRLDLINITNSMGCVGSMRDSRELAMSEGGLTQSSELMGRVWQGLYTGVRKANTTIDGLNGSPLAESLKNRYIAEAKVLRAYFYFHLLRLWGDIPFRETEIVTNDQIPVTPLKESYNKLIADLEWAIPNMWASSAKPLGRVDVTVARILLANIYLTLASSANSYNSATTARALKPLNDAFKDSITVFYTKAKVLAQTIISQPGRHSLVSDWTKIWGRTETDDYRNNPEFIWVNQTIPGVSGFNIAFIPAYTQYTPAYNGGQTLNVAYEHVASYDSNDIRLKEGYIWEYHLQSATNKITIERWRRRLNDKAYPPVTTTIIIRETADSVIREASYWALSPKKYFDQQYKAIEASGPNYAYPFFRMTEAYLILAEAENELNGMTTVAINAINPIRARAGIPSYSASQFSKQDFREKILDERLWEFAMEGKDYYDLIRMGQLEERCRGVETTSDGRDVRPNPRPRNAEDYWLPYPVLEKGLNSFLAGKVRMDFQ